MWGEGATTEQKPAFSWCRVYPLKHIATPRTGMFSAVVKSFLKLKETCRYFS